MRIILIGFMGAGKTTVGKVLAKKLGCRLLDTDQLIEQKHGMSVQDIFRNQGEETFRRLETETLKELGQEDSDWVLSVGGGLPVRNENRALLRQMGTVVFLRVQPDTVLFRLKDDTSRPLLQGSDVKERVSTLMNQRIPLYQEAARVAVDVDGKTPEEIGTEILEVING